MTCDHCDVSLTVPITIVATQTTLCRACFCRYWNIPDVDVQPGTSARQRHRTSRAKKSAPEQRRLL